MSKVIIPEHLVGKELYKFLVANKSALINEKKSMVKRTEPVFHSPSFLFTKADGATKAPGDNAENPTEDTGVLRVKVAANTSMWCDNQMDVLLPDNAAKSLRDRKGMIPHIHDHIWELTATVGEVVNIYYQDLPLSELGVNKAGNAQVLVFETDIRKDYNEKVYNKYKAGKVNQHSIGLQYVKIELAINDEEYEKEMDFWNKYIDQVINKEMCTEKGYFWVVSEIKLMENSAVLFGSNILTPTLSNEQKDAGTFSQPPEGTEETPPKADTSKTEVVDWGKIADTLFVN